MALIDNAAIEKYVTNPKLQPVDEGVKIFSVSDTSHYLDQLRNLNPQQV